MFVLVCVGGDKGLPLDREKTDKAHRQMVVFIKGKGEIPC